MSEVRGTGATGYPPSSEIAWLVTTSVLVGIALAFGTLGAAIRAFHAPCDAAVGTSMGNPRPATTERRVIMATGGLLAMLGAVLLGKSEIYASVATL